MTMGKKNEMSEAKAKAIAEFEGDDSPLTIAERYLHKAKDEVYHLDITATQKKKIMGHITAAWVKLMELKCGVEDKIDDILLRFDDSQFGEEDVRRDCRELYAMVESNRDKYGNGSDFTEENIQKAWDEFGKKPGNKYVQGVRVHKGKRRYDNCVIFLAYSRDQRDDIASIEMEAREFFKKRFGDRFDTTYMQAEYIRRECPSAYMAYC